MPNIHKYDGKCTNTVSLPKRTLNEKEEEIKYLREWTKCTCDKCFIGEELLGIYNTQPT